MSGFSVDWLTLREPFDRAARAEAAQHFDWPALVQALHTRGDAPQAPVQVLDLGCGTGASLRALAPRLGARQHWRLIDHDPALLAALPLALTQWAQAQGGEADRPHAQALHLRLPNADLQIQWQCTDLRDLQTLALQGTQLVTASALLDLVSADWLQALVARCAHAGAAVCWALNVNPQLQWQPADADDATVSRLFSADQRRDKGFAGPALGVAAAPAAAHALALCGYHVQQAESDWRVDASEGEAACALLHALIDGDAQAALRQAVDEAERLQVRGWRQRRLAQLGDATLGLQLGHTDLLAWPVSTN